MELALIGEVAAWLPRARAAGLRVALRRADLPPGTDASGLVLVEEDAGFLGALDYPRRYLLAGPSEGLDAVLDRASATMEPGDVVIDLSPSWWCDTLRRFRRMRHRSLFHVDAVEFEGPAGRVLLASGDARGVELALPVLAALAAPGRAVGCGAAGAAHWVGEVAAGLAAARAQAASEARQLLEAFPARLEVGPVAAALGLAAAGADPRAAWLPDDALRLQAAVPLLAQAAMLELAEALEDGRAPSPGPRLGPFVLPEDIL